MGRWISVEEEHPRWKQVNTATRRTVSFMGITSEEGVKVEIRLTAEPRSFRCCVGLHGNCFYLML